MKLRWKLLIPFFILNAAIVLALAGLLVLSEAHPLSPGSSLYRLQDTAEQWRLRLSAGEVRRAQAALLLAERRLSDLAQAREAHTLNAAAVAFDRALVDALQRIDACPEAARADLREELLGLLDRAQTVVASLQPDSDIAIPTLQRKIATLQDNHAPPLAAALPPEPVELSSAAPIPFLSLDIEHTIWPLMGGHDGLECEDCHEQGVYAGTPDDCEDCHQIPDSELYPDHFEGECLECHLVDSWEPSDWDHADIIDCQSCHLDESPGEHYARSNDNAWLLSTLSDRQATPLQGSLLEQRHYDRCADCHTGTDDWLEITFDHFGFTNCQSCHSLEGDLADHYEGQCAICHSTDDWDPMAFEHANVDRCRSCHLKDSPGGHYVRADNFLWYASWQPEQSDRQSPSLFSVQQASATCANCHPNTEDWTDFFFDHSGFDDCEACHPRQGELEIHYAGQCSNCHSIDSWENVSFDHNGYPDCQECHSLEEDHYPDQCSLCHSIDDWQQVSFSHQGFAACSSCHAWENPNEHLDGPCSLCHTTNEWTEIIYEHSNSDDCRSCHVTSFEHYRGQCSLCHNTVTWAGAIEPHSGLINCGSCHFGSPAHYTGMCANCHNTTNWEEVDFDHTNYTDCRACHGAPEQHYPAQCSACHSTENWSNSWVNHVVLSNCSSCHTPPGGHWPGQCSTCHNWQTWSNIIYTHYLGSDCASCHAAPSGHWAGQCSICHNMANWTQISVDHSVFVNCVTCHAPPAGHWPGQCSSCHNTNNWDDYTFSHEGFDNCKACHSGDRPAGHLRGQCSKCHNVDSWSIPDTPTPTPEPPTPTPTPIPPTPTPTPEPPTPTPTPEPAE